MIICLLICSNVAYLTAVTRDMFAFARDGGLPFLALDLQNKVLVYRYAWYCRKLTDL